MFFLDFGVAGHRFRLCFHEDDEPYKDLLPSYAPFLLKTADGPMLFSMEIGPGLVNTDAEGDELGQFDCNGIMHGIYRTANGYKIVIGNMTGGVSCALQTSKDFSKCFVTLEGETSNRAFGINNAIMIAFAFAGAYKQTVLMHASVIMNKNKGYLFLGKSGTGKSTHSRLWMQHVPGSDLLNDDNPAVRVVRDKVYVYGTPWSGKTPCYRNLYTEVGAFLRLKQAPENVISREMPVRAFASVLSSCSTMLWDKESYNSICGIVEDIIKKVPAYFMACRPDKEAAELSFSTIVR